jgi:hypothetical protein
MKQSGWKSVLLEIRIVNLAVPHIIRDIAGYVLVESRYPRAWQGGYCKSCVFPPVSKK